MNTETTQLALVMALALEIDKRPGFFADATIDFVNRQMTVWVIEGGQEVYRGSIELNCPASEAKARKVRHELERIQGEVA